MKNKKVILKLNTKDKYKNLTLKEIFNMNSKRFFKNRECENQFITEIENKKPISFTEEERNKIIKNNLELIKKLQNYISDLKFRVDEFGKFNDILIEIEYLISKEVIH